MDSDFLGVEVKGGEELSVESGDNKACTMKTAKPNAREQKVKTGKKERREETAEMLRKETEFWMEHYQRKKEEIEQLKFELEQWMFELEQFRLYDQ